MVVKAIAPATRSDKQNYICKSCGRQFIGDHNLDYPGCHSALLQRLKRMFVRGMGIHDIAEAVAAVEQISIGKVRGTPC